MAVKYEMGEQEDRPHKEWRTEQIRYVTIKRRIETVEGNTTAGRLLGVLKLVKKKNDYKIISNNKKTIIVKKQEILLNRTVVENIRAQGTRATAIDGTDNIITTNTSRRTTYNYLMCKFLTMTTMTTMISIVVTTTIFHTCFGNTPQGKPLAIGVDNPSHFLCILLLIRMCIVYPL